MILVLARTVHAFLEDRKINEAVRKLGEKEYYFRIDTQKLSGTLEPGMLAFSSDGQLVYILEIIDDRTPEEEAAYTGILTKIFADNPVIKSGGKGIEPKILSAVEKVVYTGIVVELVNKKFIRTEKEMRFRSTEKINGEISKGDIVPIVLHTKDGRKERHYVLVQRIIENASQKQRVMNTRRRPTNWFYKKTDKGYKKTRYAQEVIENGEIKNKPTNKQIEKRTPEASKSEKGLKEADKEINRKGRNFVIRQRKD